MPWKDYTHFLRRMNRRFEACVFKCVSENPEFKKELHIIADRLRSLISIPNELERLSLASDGDISGIVSVMAAESLEYLGKYDSNVGVVTAPLAIDKSVVDSSGASVISGTQGLADFLGCSKSMAFAIIKSGTLKEQGIQYMVGKCWKFNRELLTTYLQSNPNLLSKIRCKKPNFG